MKRKFLIALLAVMLVASLAVSLAACNKVTITLDKTTLDLSANGSASTLTATVENSEEVVEWTTSDSTVVSITPASNKCSVRPLKEGKATVTATIGKVSATCEVTVGPAKIVTIMKDGANVTGSNLSVEMGSTLTLTATSSDGSSLSWMSGDENIATVNGGVVTAVKPGTTDITAYVSGSIRASVTVTVTPRDGSVYYDLKFGWGGKPEYFTPDEEPTEEEKDKQGEPIPNGQFYYWAMRSGWGQQVDVDYLYYLDGTIYASYTSDWSGEEDPNYGGGYFQGFQVMCYRDDIVPYTTYKFACKITVDQDCFISIAGNIVELKQGENNITDVYFTTGQDPKFTIMTGYDTMDNTNGYFVQNLVMTISDMSWTSYTSSQLLAPTFVYDASSGIIIISDPNTNGVGKYLLNFYDADGIRRATANVENGKVVDTSRVPGGTYTVKLVAIAESSGYIDSGLSSSSAEISVAEHSISYELEAIGAAGAVATPGTWTYWSSPWVGFTAKNYSDGTVYFSFSNNEGNWDSTQLYYREPSAENGKYYEFTLKIISDNSGHVILSGNEIEILEGEHEYTITNYQQKSGDATVAFIFALYQQAGIMPYASLEITMTSFKEIEAPEGSGGNQGGGQNTPIEPPTGDPVAIPKQADGNLEFGENNKVADNVISSPDKLYYWNDQGWVASYVTVSTAKVENGIYTISYSGMTPSCWFGLQLFYKASNHVVGNAYTLKFKINSSVAGSITVNGKVCPLTVGDNDIEVTYTETAMASISIQFGVESAKSVIEAGTFIISDIAFIG